MGGVNGRCEWEKEPAKSSMPVSAKIKMGRSSRRERSRA